eukprot:1336230-Alexandrium_andersonii.AAC.1
MHEAGPRAPVSREEGLQLSPQRPLALVLGCLHGDRQRVLRRTSGQATAVEASLQESIGVLGIRRLRHPS